MSTGWIWHEIFAWHDTGTAAGFRHDSGQQPYQHFESAESKTRLASLVEVSGIADSLERLRFTPATHEDLLRVHDVAHVERMQRLSAQPRGGDMGDGASPFGHGGFDIARWSAGGVIKALDAVLAGEVDNAYALVRPPGHHAVPESGMGFCMFANIAIAIEHARARGAVSRVAVVDWDVHHGNGTEACFESDPNILTISLHQDGNFPRHTGKVEHRGVGEGYGAAVNIPLPAGSGQGAYLHALSRVVKPALEAFAPEVIIVACGFDASNADPLGRMMLTSQSYREMTRELMQIAEKLCSGRLVFSHEGGYSPVYVPLCGLAVLEELSGTRTEVTDAQLASWGTLPGQLLQPHQAELIEAVRQSIETTPAS